MSLSKELATYFEVMTKDGHSPEYVLASEVVNMIKEYNRERIKYGEFVDTPYPLPTRRLFRKSNFCPLCSGKLSMYEGREYEETTPTYYDLIAYEIYSCGCGYIYADMFDPCPDAGLD